MSIDVPSLKQVKDLAEGLLGREVEVGEGDPINTAPGESVLVGVYAEPMRSVAGVAVMDLPLAVFMGAALGLLPPGGAEDMVDENDPSESVIENSCEFLNTLAHPFFESTKHHQRLDQLFRPGIAIPKQVADLAASTFRRDVKCTIKGYGDGTLSMIYAG